MGQVGGDTRGRVGRGGDRPALEAAFITKRGCGCGGSRCNGDRWALLLSSVG